MGRRFHNSGSDDDTKIDISPLIDCVFILLIFFIVTTTFVNEKGFSVEVPDPAPPMDQPEEEPTTLVFEVTAGGEVFLNGEQVGLGAVQSRIRNSKLGKDSTVIVQAIGDTESDLPIRVYDEARIAGATTVTFDYRNTRN